MPRGKRHYLPGYAWHITHRCHEKEFLLKFGMGGRIPQNTKECERWQVVGEHRGGKQSVCGNGEEAARFEGEGPEDY